MSRLIPWLAYIASVLIANRFYRGFWIVGPVFAAACLIARYGDLRKCLAGRHGIFLLASTFTYAAVYGIGENGWQFKQDLLDMLLGSVTAGVVLGSLLMPYLHSLIYKTDLPAVRRVSLWLVLSWYGAQFLSMIDQSLNLPGNVDYLLVAIALWQGLYLRFLKIP